MTIFFRLLNESDKDKGLLSAIESLNEGKKDTRVFEVKPESFQTIPGAPFAYWVSDTVRETFQRLPAFEGEGRTVKVGLQTGNDYRFIRLFWEIDE